MKASGVLALALIPAVFGSVQRRDELPPLVRANIPLVRTADGRYGVTVNMSSSNPSTFLFALSTSTGLISVQGTACDSCTGAPKYDPASSTSARISGGVQTSSVLNQSVQGTVIREDCTLQKDDGSAWAYPNQTIIVTNQTSPIFSSSVSGLLGLGTNTNDGGFNETIFGGWLSRNPGRSNFSYGMKLNPPQQDGSLDVEGGLLHWVVPDTSSVQGTISVKDKLSVGPTSINSDWIVGLDSFSTTTGSGTTVSAKDQRVAIDPFFAGIFLPQSIARSIYAGIPGSSRQQAETSVTAAYTVPCDSKLTVDVQFGDTTVTLKEDVLLLRNGSTCTSVLEEWNDANISEYLFGATFISAVYLIFTINGPENGSIGFGLRQAPSSKIHPAAIAGMVIGSVAIVVIAIFSAVLVVRSRNRRKEAREEATIQPFTSTTRTDEQRGLLMPQTPTTADTLGGFNISPMPSPNPSATTTPYSSMNTHTHQSLTNTPMVEISASSPINIDHLAPPPPYSGGSSEVSHPEPVQQQQVFLTQPSVSGGGTSIRPTSAGSTNSTAYGYPSEKRRRA
ncbi:hypothetical protein ONZ45_g2812 [Pleurotus djamor]|nr:hypothetical protein ONZ45_g2812 [Pleurotus djamor]